jgi:hypothetical protein
VFSWAMTHISMPGCFDYERIQYIYVEVFGDIRLGLAICSSQTTYELNHIIDPFRRVTLNVIDIKL